MRTKYTLIICDLCRNVISDEDHPRPPCKINIQLSRDLLIANRPGSYHLNVDYEDICDDCMKEIIEAIDLKKIRQTIIEIANKRFEELKEKQNVQ